DSPCTGENSTTSDAPAAGCADAPSATSIGAPGASAGQRLGNQRTSYGSGASRPPTQNGHAWLGRLGRPCRWPTTLTHSPVSTSRRSSPAGASSLADPGPLVTSRYLQFPTNGHSACHFRPDRRPLSPARSPPTKSADGRLFHARAQ